MVEPQLNLVAVVAHLQREIETGIDEPVILPAFRMAQDCSLLLSDKLAGCCLYRPNVGHIAEGPAGWTWLICGRSDVGAYTR